MVGNVQCDDRGFDAVTGSRFVHSAFVTMDRRMLRSSGPMDRGKHVLEGMSGYGELPQPLVVGKLRARTTDRPVERDDIALGRVEILESESVVAVVASGGVVVVAGTGPWAVARPETN